MAHQIRLTKNLKDLEEQIKPLLRKRVYSEPFEEEVREIVETLNVLVQNNSIFHRMTNLILPKTMPLDWSEDDSYDEAYDKLMIKTRESQRAVKSALLFLDTHSAEENQFIPPESPLTPIIDKMKHQQLSEKGVSDLKRFNSEKTVKDTSIGYIKPPIPFIDIKIPINRRELGIFFIGVVVGIIVTIVALSGINFNFG